MAANWDDFKNNIQDFLTKQESKSTDDTAKFLANEYHNAVSTAETILGNTIISGLDSSIIEIGFSEAFKKMNESNEDLGLDPYTIIATSIILYWTTAIFTPTPMHPPVTTPTLGTLLVFPGLPTPLDIAIQTAFKSGLKSISSEIGADLVSIALQLAFQLHLLTISGTYNGTMLVGTVVTPVPPIPWIGLK